MPFRGPLPRALTLTPKSLTKALAIPGALDIPKAVAPLVLIPKEHIAPLIPHFVGVDNLPTQIALVPILVILAPLPLLAARAVSRPA